MENTCSKLVFTMNLAMYTLLCHETSVHSCVFQCLDTGPKPIRPVTMTKHLVQEHFMEMSEIH